MAESKPTTRTKWWLPRFSLAALFVLVTLSAIGAWYWYQLPFEVRNATYAPAPIPFDADLADPATKSMQVVRLEIETVRRVWSRDKGTIRHGPRKVYDGRDVLLEEGHYVNGVKHGRFAQYFPSGQSQSESHYARGRLHGQSRRWTAKGELLEETNYDHGRLHGRYFLARRISRGGPEPSVTGQYEHGRPAGRWTWTVSLGLPLADRLGTLVGQFREGLPDGAWTCRAGDRIYYTAEFDGGRGGKSSAGRFEPRLAELLAQGRLSEAEVVGHLLMPVGFEFEAVPLRDAMQCLADEAETTIHVGLRGDLLPAEARRLFPPKPPTYVLPLSAGIRLRVPVDERDSFQQIELELPGAADSPSETRTIRASDWPLSGSGSDLPLIVALDRLLSPQGLACDYRHGVLWIERAEAMRAWSDPTGVSRLTPPAGSYLAETWNRPDPIPMEFVETPLKDALAYTTDVHGGRIKFGFSGFPPRAPGTALIPNRAPDIDSPVTIRTRGLPFKHSLGLMLELTGCQATLRGETIVVAPQTAR